MIEKVIHVLSLSGIGGVQQNLYRYFSYLKNKKSNYNHSIFGNQEIDKEYLELKEYQNISKSFYLHGKFIKELISRKSIISFNNNLGDDRIFKILKYFPVRNVLFHEHGMAWNHSKEEKLRNYMRNGQKSEIIIANSIATKIILMKKFMIPKDKIKVVYYGFDIKEIKKENAETKNYLNFDKRKIKIGFIGRFDTPKGIHILIECARLLRKEKNFLFLIAGDGPLKSNLTSLGSGLSNLKFIGRFKNPTNFISKIDVLIVPSIREPFGIINIEAGFCKKPVIAANVDGIPEIIEHKRTGLLIEPSNPLSMAGSIPNCAPLPECIVNPKTKELAKPLEIDPKELAEVLFQSTKDKNKLIKYGDNLYHRVRKNFTLSKYYQKLETIYRDYYN